jgi:hypothetical protein
LANPPHKKTAPKNIMEKPNRRKKVDPVPRPPPSTAVVGAEVHNGDTAITLNAPQTDPYVLRVFATVCFLLISTLTVTYVALVLSLQEVPVSLTSLLFASVGAILGLLTPGGLAGVSGSKKTGPPGGPVTA